MCKLSISVTGMPLQNIVTPCVFRDVPELFSGVDVANGFAPFRRAGFQ